jgi:hypothetical protein
VTRWSLTDWVAASTALGNQFRRFVENPAISGKAESSGQAHRFFATLREFRLAGDQFGQN